jgi:hypothetical protein
MKWVTSSLHSKKEVITLYSSSISFGKTFDQREFEFCSQVNIYLPEIRGVAAGTGLG